MEKRNFEYQDGDTTCRGVVATNASGPAPTVIIIHEFAGITDHIHAHVERVANDGFTAVAIDIMGEGKTGHDLDSCMALITPFFEDRAHLQRRVIAGYEATKALPEVDAEKIAAVGFCFGGLCGLDLARAGADIKGVASVHGVFSAPENVERGNMTAKVLLCQGYDDPQVPHDDLHMIAKELDDNDVDWQFIYFSHTKHSFTDPKAAEIGPPEFGRVYNKVSAERAWTYCHDFFKECLL